MDFEHRSDCWYKDVCQQEICGDSCIRFLEMSYLMNSSGIPKIRQLPDKLIPDTIDYESFCELADIKDDIKNLVDSHKFNLYICGNNTGNGKTTWAIKLLTKYFDSIWAGNGFRTRGMFIHVPTLLLQLKNFQDPLTTEYKQNIRNSDLIVFDDIAVSNISPFDYGNLLMFIDSRILEGKANIFTSNQVDRRNLESVLGSRLASRIWNVSTIVELKGKDRRNG